MTPQTVFDDFDDDEEEEDEDSAEWLKKRGADGNGTVRPDEVNDLKAGTGRVLALLLDKNWHSAVEIRDAAGDGVNQASEGLRRLRDIYPMLPQLKLRCEKRRVAELKRLYEYRLVEENNEEVPLASQF